MIRHIVLWDLADGLSAEEKAPRATDIKTTLEALRGVIPGLLDIRVYHDLLPSSNAEIVLDSLLEDRRALEQYLAHPAHVKAGQEVVRPFVQNRRCADFEVL